jgi:hypothetical protein
MRLSGTKTGAINQYRGLGNQLWDLAGNRPSLDLPFADNKSLVDATTGANLVDFTRASSGTYVDSEGVIRTATTNLLLRSEDLTVSPWTTVGSVTVTADSSQGLPFTGASVYRIDYLGTPTQISHPFTYLATNYTASVWVKGTAGETIRFAGQATVEAENYTLTGEWQRLTQAWTATASAQTFNLNTSAGATAQTIYVAAPQLEKSTTVGEYIPTTSTINSAPRFDHDPTTGESLGLLVEEQRTNLLLRSEELETTWGTFGLSVTANQETAPNGALTADLISINGSGQGIWQPVTSAPGVQYTFSVYVKLGTMSAANYRIAVRDDTAGVFIASDVEPTQAPSSNGWTRISYTATAPAGCTTIRFYAFRNTANVTGTIYLWGAQVEAGAFPTSYIPTTAATATRAADVASISGSNFSSWYRQDEGTIFCEGAVPVGVDSSRALVSMLTTTPMQNGFNFVTISTTARIQLVVDNNSTQFSASLAPNSFPPGEYRKLAMAMKVNDFAGVVDDAGTVSQNSSGTMPTPTQMQIGLGPSNAQPCKPIKRLTYWPARLPNETLQTITQ